MNETTPVPEPTPDAGGAPVPPAPETFQGERAIIVGFCIGLVVLLVGGGITFLRLWRDPVWARSARVTWRVGANVRSNAEDLDVRTRYANELVKLAAISPRPLRMYLDWRADQHCGVVRLSSPPGTFGTCRRLHLERLLVRGDGEGAVAAALHEMEDAPPEWVGPLYRYAGRGAVLQHDWDLAREHFSAAFSHASRARDALYAGWACLRAGQPAVALDWLDRAFAANRGYPPPYRQAIASRMRPSPRRDRYLAAIDAEAIFYDACRTAALAGIDGARADVPDWPEPR